MLNLVQEENEQDQVHIFQDLDFKSSEIHLLTITFFEYLQQDY